MSIFSKLIKQLKTDMKNRPLLDIIQAVIMWMSITLASIFIASLILVIFPFIYLIDRERHSLHKLAIIWGKIIQYLNPWWKFEIIGKENLANKNLPIIYVANHQSQADILALFILSIRFRWLAKESLFKIPLFGWAMSAVGYVSVKRGSQKSSERCMRIASKHLEQGTSMAFFPEGTRSATGELGRFKNGAFRLALATNTPIIPITINGCTKLLPKGSLLPKGAIVTITILPAVYPNNLSSDELMLEVRNKIAAQLHHDLLNKD